MASLNLSKFWTTPLHLVPNSREDRDRDSTWGEPSYRWPCQTTLYTDSSLAIWQY